MTGPLSCFVHAGSASALTFTGVSLMRDGSIISVGAFHGPGIQGAHLWLLSDSSTASAANQPGYVWPDDASAAAAAADASGDSGSSHSRTTGIAVGVAVGAAVLLASALAALLLFARSHRKRQGGSLLGKPAAGGPGYKPHWFDSWLGGGVGGVAQQRGITVDCLEPNSQQQKPDGDSTAAAVMRIPSDPSAAAGAAAAAVVDGQGLSHPPLQPLKGPAAITPAVAAVDSTSASASTAAASNKAAGSSSGNANARSVERTIALSLERWNAAVSSTTLQLMQQRLQRTNMQYARGTTSSNSTRHLQMQQQLLLGGAAASAAAAASSSLLQSPSDCQDVVLHEHIGAGSNGTVFAGSWRGKRVAVKLMDLPNSALLSSEDDHEGGQPVQGVGGLQGSLGQGMRRRRRSAAPHMAVMEAVLSSAMSHPNVSAVGGVGGLGGGAC